MSDHAQQPHPKTCERKTPRHQEVQAAMGEMPQHRCALQAEEHASGRDVAAQSSGPHTELHGVATGAAAWGAKTHALHPGKFTGPIHSMGLP